jgi:hypothetical protein
MPVGAGGAHHVGMGHERRDVDLARVVELLRSAEAADGLADLHHLLAPDVVLHTCDVVVIGADAVLSTVQRWLAAPASLEVLEVVDGGDRVALRYERSGRQGAVFLTAGADGRVAAATVTPSAA